MEERRNRTPKDSSACQLLPQRCGTAGNFRNLRHQALELLQREMAFRNSPRGNLHRARARARGHDLHGRA